MKAVKPPKLKLWPLAKVSKSHYHFNAADFGTRDVNESSRASWSRARAHSSRARAELELIHHELEPSSSSWRVLKIKFKSAKRARAHNEF
jgi:hypothetical protein